MKSSRWLFVLAIAMGCLPDAGRSQSVSSISAISGEWRISKAALVDRTGVQAYSDDQLRALVGNSLLINRKSAHWRVSHGRGILHEHNWLAEQCVDPTIQFKARKRFVFRCSGDGLFAPDTDIQMLPNGELKLDWWDGVVLQLRKIK